MEGLDQHLRDHIALGVGPEFVKEVKEDIATLSNRINNLPRGGGLPSGLVMSVNGTKPDTSGNITLTIPSPVTYTFTYLEDSDYKYVAKAVSGTTPEKPAWRIFRATKATGVIEYAYGDTSYVYPADNFEALDYY